VAKNTHKSKENKAPSGGEEESNKRTLTGNEIVSDDTVDLSTNSLLNSMSKLSKSYRAAAVEHFINQAKEVGENSSLLHAEKVATLFEAVYGISGVLDQILRSAPDAAPELFENRENKEENAFEFTRRVYSEFIERGLSKADIRRLDRKLYMGILNRERRFDDNSLKLQKKSAINDKLLAALPSHAEIMASIPEIFRRQVKLYRMHSVRKYQRRQRHAPK
jgi:hypothetical protein